MKKPKVYVVEGRNDATRLKQVFKDIKVLSVNGSSVDKDVLKLLERIKNEYEIVLVTDPDYPGEKIRKTISNKIGNVSHIFVEQKQARNKNNTKIGIEHMSDEDLINTFKYKIKNNTIKSDITIDTLYKQQLIGHTNSKAKRKHLSDKLNIGHVNGKTLLERLNMIGLSKKELISLMNDTVVGNLEIINDFKVKDIDFKRTIRIWTPSNYSKNIKYPVIYMHDGQNLFDAKTSYAGEWEVDETIENMIFKDKINGFIVVGIDNSELRMEEYKPNWETSDTAISYTYMKFITEGVVPYINERYNTIRSAEETTIMGSSMGGLISFYIGLENPHIFGNIAALSTSFQINSIENRNKYLEKLKLNNFKTYPRLYLDAGSLEHSKNYIEPVYETLVELGYDENKIITHLEENGAHNEDAWKKRFPNIIKKLYNI